MKQTEYEQELNWLYCKAIEKDDIDLAYDILSDHPQAICKCEEQTFKPKVGPWFCGVLAKPTIEQELEAGLNNKLKAFSAVKPRGVIKDPFTRIFLPIAKYVEYLPEPKPMKMEFHDIPVFSYSGDEIIYCTD